MEIRISSNFCWQPFEIDIITQSGNLSAAGRRKWMARHDAYPVFGFNEMGDAWAAPFNQQPFLPAGQPYAVA